MKPPLLRALALCTLLCLLGPLAGWAAEPSGGGAPSVSPAGGSPPRGDPSGGGAPSVSPAGGSPPRGDPASTTATLTTTLTPAPASPASVLDFTLPAVDGKPTPLRSFAGKVLLLVNVASHCGFTGQYAGLQRLQKKYEGRGFTVLAFPANDFFGQEPGTNEEIATFCQTTYGVTFPVFAKISVSGETQHPLYRFLTDEATNPGFSGAITWNFNKFLVDRQGKIIGRFGTRTDPEDKDLVALLEQAL